MLFKNKIKNLFFILILSIFCNSSIAQDIVSLKNQIKTVKNDSILTALNIELAQQYSFNPDSAIYYYNQALLLSIMNNNKFTTTKVLRYIGIEYYRQGKFDNAIDYYLRAYSTAIDIKDSVSMFKCLNNLGLAYSFKGVYSISLNYYFKSLSIIEKLNDTVSLASSYNNIGNLYVNIKQYNKAIDFFFKALKIREKYKNERGISECYNNIGNAFFESKKFAEAEKYYNQSLQLSLKNNEKLNQSAVYSNLGAIFYEQNQNKKAERYFLLALKISKELNDLHSISSGLGNLCEININNKNYNKAIIYGEQGLQIAKEIGVLTTQRVIYGRLSAVYTLIGNFEKALQYHISYKKFNDSIFNQKNNDNIKQLEYQYQLEKKELEVNNLKKDKHIAEINFEKEKNLKRFFVIGFILLIIVIVLGLRIYKIKQNTAKLITEQRDEIMMINEELLQQKEEILMQTHELEKINQYLEDRINEEVLKSREKDVLLTIQSRQAQMGEMIGNIAHQWRQPLSSLSIIIQNIKMAYEYNELNSEYIKLKTEKSNDLIKYMSQTIDDFKNFFKPEKEPDLFNINEAINKTISFFEINVNKSKLKIDKEFAENISAYGYSNEFMQVVMIILNNAKDAIIERKIENPHITISTYTNSNNDSEISIRDNAGGISEENLNKVFKLYFSTKDNDKGTGIGLYMAKTIIEKNMNGTLLVANSGEGAIFTIKLKSNKVEF